MATFCTGVTTYFLWQKIDIFIVLVGTVVKLIVTMAKTCHFLRIIISNDYFSKKPC